MKILYISCHGILEFDEVRMFSDMGHTIFSPSGAYQTPSSDFPFRPKITNRKYDPTDLEEYNRQWYIWNWNQIAPKEFVDRFDIVYVMGMPRWIYHNWESFKHKPVIWRTIGQSNQHQEMEIKNFKKDKPNLKIVRYSPTERNYNNFAGEDAVIRFGKRPDEWNGWNGSDRSVITVVQSMKRRWDHCSWDIFERLACKVPSKLYGGDNPEVNPLLFKGSPTYSELQSIYQNHRAYFYAGTKPSNYTLNFMEAWMTGIPIVALDEPLLRDENKGVYEVPSLIEHGSSGFIAKNEEELEYYMNVLLSSDQVANLISKQGRDQAIKYFDECNVVPQWEEFFKTL